VILILGTLTVLGTHPCTTSDDHRRRSSCLLQRPGSHAASAGARVGPTHPVFLRRGSIRVSTSGRGCPRFHQFHGTLPPLCFLPHLSPLTASDLVQNCDQTAPIIEYSHFVLRLGSFVVEGTGLGALPLAL
jgi:hypothetical protein